MLLVCADSVVRDVGTEAGLVGCILSLKMGTSKNIKDYNLIYPDSGDIMRIVDIGKCCTSLQFYYSNTFGVACNHFCVILSVMFTFE